MSVEVTTTKPYENQAQACRDRGWLPGTKIVGDEGYGPSVYLITALGERAVLARMLSHKENPVDTRRESLFTLSCRDWKVVAEEDASGRV